MFLAVKSRKYLKHKHKTFRLYGFFSQPNHLFDIFYIFVLGPSPSLCLLPASISRCPSNGCHLWRKWVVVMACQSCVVGLTASGRGVVGSVRSNWAYPAVRLICILYAYCGHSCECPNTLGCRRRNGVAPLWLLYWIAPSIDCTEDDTSS